jgi:aspartate aminotransferase-like enzyme
MTPSPAIRNFLPGPVPIHPETLAAFQRPPVSHRGEGFLREFESLRASLRRLVRARHVQVLLGSGTLANDLVGAQLSLLGGAPGVVARNGEFGARLVDHARRWGLNFREVAAPWGEPLPFDELRRAARDHGAAWIWAVRCETSTGVLNDLGELRSIAAETGARLCVDGVSAIGTIDEDWSGIWLATGAGGKGLAAPPGLSMLFHHDTIAPSPRLPRYLDLGTWDEASGVPFTTSSNLVRALAASVGRLERQGPARFAATAARARWLRPRLEEAGLRVLANERVASPAVFTLAPPDGTRALDLAEKLEARGFLLSCRSGYLVERNLLQVCLMGERENEELEELLEAIRQALAESVANRASNGTPRRENGADARARAPLSRG